MEVKTPFRQLSKKAKVEYIWDYYRWHIVITVIAAIVIFLFVKHYVTYQDPLMDVVMVNCYNYLSSDAAGFDEFAEQYGYDLDAHPIALNTSVYVDEDSATSLAEGYQIITTLLSVGGEDAFLCPGDLFLHYAELGSFMNLENVLSEDTLAKYEDSLVYYTDEETGETYPCGVEIESSEWLYNNGYYYDACYFGIPNAADNLDVGINFAEFLLNY